MRKQVFFLFLFSVFSISAQAKNVSVLFIGNSYTYLEGQGDSTNPMLPKLIKQIVESIDSDFRITYASNTPGGWSFERHFNDPISTRLMSDRYDEVILQGQSIESLQLTPWWEQNGNRGVKGFEIFLPKVLDLVFKNNSSVTLYVNWGWNAKNSALQEGHPGLYFPPGSGKPGEKWCGRNKFEFQKMINDSYEVHSKKYPVKLSNVGSNWLALQSSGLVTEDELYITGDWSHPSVLGGFVTALILVRDVFHLDISKNKFFPAGVDLQRAIAIQSFLMATS